jgi:hypothetical protein
MSPVTFEVGNRYKNMKGPYEVLAVEGDVMRIKWEDGEEITTSMAMQRRILERLEREQDEKPMEVSPEIQQAPSEQPSKTTDQARSKPKKKISAQETPGIKKQYLKTRAVCKVTFFLPPAVTGDAQSACIVGDFNDWNKTANPMKKSKGNGFTVTLELQPDREYQFRYLIDGSRWANDPQADNYVKSPFQDSENSVVAI